MPVIQREVLVAANAVNDNILAGSAFEFARGNILLSMGATQSATGLFLTINVGSDIVLEESPLSIQTRFPIIPDEMYYTDVATVGDRIVLRVRNSTGGGLTVRAIVQVTNL